MIKNVEKLIVKYNQRIVGTLVLLKNKEIAFQYDDSWINDGFSISPNSLPLNKNIYISKSKLFNGLYGVFNDSLPDGWGQLVLSRFLSKEKININTLNPLTILSLVSDNGLGGLSYEPTQDFKLSTDYNDFDDLSIKINQLLDDKEVDDLDLLYRLGGSSGGARPKAHIKYQNEDWIVKFGCRYDSKNIGLEEYKANELAKKCGINVNEFTLFKSNNNMGYFGSKRFDRDGGKRIHMISLAALLETTHHIPNLDYGHLFSLINLLNCGVDDLYEAFRRMCFNVYYGNKDDHSKNFSFIYNEDDKRYHLSKAYDITKTPNAFEHEMTINHKGNPTDEDIISLAKTFHLDINKCELIMKQIKEIIKNN